MNFSRATTKAAMPQTKLIQVDTAENYAGVRKVALSIDELARKCGFIGEIESTERLFPKRPCLKAVKWLTFTLKLNRLLKEKRPKLLIIHHPYLVPLVIVRDNLKIVFVIHGPISKRSQPKLLPRVTLRMTTWLSSLLSHTTVVVSEGLVNSIPEIIRNRAVVIHNRPSAAFFLSNKRLADQFSYLKTFDGLRLVNFGRVCHQKNQLFLLKLVDAMRRDGLRVQLVIFGDGEDLEDSKDLARRLELRIRVFPESPNSENDVIFMPPASGLSWISSYFDYGVFPSRYEGFSLSILECVIAGLRVVASDCEFGPAEIYERLQSSSRTEDLASFLRLMPIDEEGMSSLEDWRKALLTVRFTQDFPNAVLCAEHFRISFEREWGRIIEGDCIHS